MFHGRMSLNSVLLLLLVNFGSGFRKYQVKPHSSPWFSAAFAAVIVHRNRFLDSRPQSEGSYKVGSVRLSFHLSIGFLRIGSLVFSENQHGVRGPYIVVCDRAGCFGKNTHWAKMTKNSQKWLKIMVFGLFKKIMLLVLSGICVK